MSGELERLAPICGELVQAAPCVRDPGHDGECEPALAVGRAYADAVRTLHALRWTDPIVAPLPRTLYDLVRANDTILERVLHVARKVRNETPADATVHDLGAVLELGLQVALRRRKRDEERRQALEQLEGDRREGVAP